MPATARPPYENPTVAECVFDPQVYVPPPPVLRLEVVFFPSDDEVADGIDANGTDACLQIQLIAYGYKPEPHVLLEFLREEVERVGFKADGRGYIEDSKHGVASWSFRLVFLEHHARA